jgi:chromate reductase
MKQILLISGSLRAKSINTGLLRAFAETIGDRAHTDWANLQLPLFNEELEESYPEVVETLGAQITAADVIIIASPEYNRCMTGALKNAIDWTSRPHFNNVWEGKMVLVVSASPGSIAGAVGVYQVKQALLHLDATVLGQPEFMVPYAGDKFDEHGNLIDEKTQSFIEPALERLLS